MYSRSFGAICLSSSLLDAMPHFVAGLGTSSHNPAGILTGRIEPIEKHDKELCGQLPEHEACLEKADAARWVSKCGDGHQLHELITNEPDLPCVN